MRLIPSIGSNLRRRFILLAPDRHAANSFANSSEDASLHQRLLSDAQKLRGRVYLEDGAIQASQLSADGRHVQAADPKSWHLLTLDDKGRVAACTRYLSHAPTVSFSELNVSSSGMAQSKEWGRAFRSAIEAELGLASKRRCSYVEMGGWVISESLRCTTEAVRMVLTSYGLARMFGGALGISTVTTRHGSSSILRRIGGGSLWARGGELPPYFDPHYNCEMEILRFDSERPSPRYRTWIDDCRNYLETTPVICAKPARKPLEEIRIAVSNSFLHTNRNPSVDAISEKAAWERSTGVA